MQILCSDRIAEQDENEESQALFSSRAGTDRIPLQKKIMEPVRKVEVRRKPIKGNRSKHVTPLAKKDKSPKKLKKQAQSTKHLAKASKDSLSNLVKPPAPSKAKPEALKLKPSKGLPPLSASQAKQKLRNKQQQDEYKNLDRQLRRLFAQQKAEDIVPTPSEQPTGNIINIK